MGLFNVGRVKNMNDTELICEIHKALADENKTTAFYLKLIADTNNDMVKSCIEEIMNDEIQHIWRLNNLLMSLDKNYETQLNNAIKEGEL